MLSKLSQVKLEFSSSFLLLMKKKLREWDEKERKKLFIHFN